MARANDEDKNGKLNRKQYEKELRRMQVALCRLQEWVKHTACASS